MKGEDILVLIVMCAALALGVVLGAFVQGQKFQAEAVQRDAAQYNPTNGVFEWKELK